MLEEIGQIVTGKTPSSNVIGAFSSSGIPFVTPKDMDGRRWIETTERYLSEAGRQSLKNYLIPKDSVAVSCIGSDMGKAILLKKDSVTNQQINTIIVDASKHNPKYIYYVLSLKQEELKSIAGGSATPILNKGHFSKVVIELPDKVDQDNIVQVLDSLDCKIELNNQINQTLESIAQAIFKSWFIDFEPVRAKIAAKQEGKDPELAAMCVISGKSEAELKQMSEDDLAELRATASLFPDELVESELGEVPKGWFKTDLSILADLNVQSWTKKNCPEKVTYVDLSNTKWGVIQQTEEFIFEKAPSRARRVLKIGDTIVGTVRPANGSYAFIQRENLTGSTGFAVLSPKHKNYAEFIYIVATDKENIKRLAHLADGGAYPAVSYDTVLNTPCVLPIENKDGVLNLFHKNVKEFYLLSASKFEENNILASIRDTLLPKLLSGELDVSGLQGEGA